MGSNFYFGGRKKLGVQFEVGQTNFGVQFYIFGGYKKMGSNFIFGVKKNRGTIFWGRYNFFFWGGGPKKIRGPIFGGRYNFFIFGVQHFWGPFFLFYFGGSNFSYFIFGVQKNSGSNFFGGAKKMLGSIYLYF